MTRLTPIDGVDTDQDALARLIALELFRAGLDSMLSYPVAIGVMGIIQDYLDTKNIDDVRKKLYRQWKATDEWWVMYHPKSSIARQIKSHTRPGMNLYGNV